MLPPMSKNHEAVDEHRDTQALLAVLDAADRLPGTDHLRGRSYALLDLAPGDTVVDVGCGGGRAVAELADQGAHAVGVDPDPQMLAAARHRWPAAAFRAATADDLPFTDASVHGYRADKVFHLLAEPQRAVAEARRVLRPGGRIVLVGQDWDAIMIDSDDPALTRALVHARADLLSAPRAARHFRQLLLDAGFEDVTVEAHTLVFTDPTMLPLATRLAEPVRASGAITHDRADAWLSEQRRRAETDRFLIALPFFVAAASAPHSTEPQ